MAQTNISIRIDEDVKKSVETLSEKMGLSLSAVTNVFYRQFIRLQGIPFPVAAEDAGDILREALRESQEQAVKNGTSEMTLDEINEIIAEVRQYKCFIVLKY